MCFADRISKSAIVRQNEDVQDRSGDNVPHRTDPAKQFVTTRFLAY